ncbi:baseplate J/gp47 family protein [Methanobrevibacter sp.]|uniref:baseplate J/gp47 family protein n=1 Tax=Methanobrevibacter sp. TaxID=66852 RepID=UPI0025D3B015|nr:baseplate J/gp47 family protein [Methanobrevibacter sp.]MBQ6511754.1 baseplate J/gp47 family protein [Methanobrevibacter sp.]
MNYTQKEYEEIFESMLEDSVANGLISRADNFASFIQNREDISNYYIMDKSVIAKMFEKVYEDITIVSDSVNIEIATGKDLDNIGDWLGIPRPLATQSSVKVTFTLNEDIQEDINIPEGVLVSTDDGIMYVTVESIFIAASDSTTTVQCMSVEAGSNFKVIENTLVNIVSPLRYNLSVTNETASSGGTDTYSDEDYRDLLLNWKLIKVKGSDEAFRYYFANLDGIDGYKLVPNWNGTGTVKVIIDPGTDYILNKAYEDLQTKVTQETEDISMFAPIDKYIDIYAIVNVDIDRINPFSELEKENIKSKILTAIKVFIDGGYRNNGAWYNGLNIGEDFIPHKLAVFLDDEISELKNITFNYPEDYILIQDEEIGVSNNITIEMI